MLVLVLVIRRLAGALATMMVASLVVYSAIYLSPGDPATLFAGSRPVTPETLEVIRRQHHLNDPLWTQYWNWLTGMLHGDLGQSFVYRQPVIGLLGERAVTTLFLVVYASTLIVVGGVALGVAAALRGGVVGAFIGVLTSVGMAVPVFVAAIGLIFMFAVNLQWFPVFGGGSGFLDRIWHLTLPAVALSLTYLAYVGQVTREAVSVELDREHVATARGRGIPEIKVIWRHVLRNALAPITTVSGITVAGMIAGAIIAERAFGVNGLGSFLVDAVQRKDFAVVQAIALIIVVAFIVANTTVDGLNALLDPRVRRGAAR